MIDIDNFIASLIKYKKAALHATGGMRAAEISRDIRLLEMVLRDQFLEYSDGRIRGLRQEYKFRKGDTIRRKSDGLEAKVKEAYEDGTTIIECEGGKMHIYVDEWLLVPHVPKFKVGDVIVPAGTEDGWFSHTILAVEPEERRYKVSDCQSILFEGEEFWELREDMYKGVEPGKYFVCKKDEYDYFGKILLFKEGCVYQCIHGHYIASEDGSTHLFSRKFFRPATAEEISEHLQAIKKEEVG